MTPTPRGRAGPPIRLPVPAGPWLLPLALLHPRLPPDTRAPPPAPSLDGLTPGLQARSVWRGRQGSPGALPGRPRCLLSVPPAALALAPGSVPLPTLPTPEAGLSPDPTRVCTWPPSQQCLGLVRSGGLWLLRCVLAPAPASSTGLGTHRTPDQIQPESRPASAPLRSSGRGSRARTPVSEQRLARASGSCHWPHCGLVNCTAPPSHG